VPQTGSLWRRWAPDAPIFDLSPVIPLGGVGGQLPYNAGSPG